MPLVGNDVVDLATDCALDRWEDSRFLGKVFSDSEQKVIRDCPRPDVLFWSLWACKEASYKVIRKMKSSESFLPRRYRVTLGVSDDSRNSSGTVDTPLGTIRVRVEAEAGFVHGLGLLDSSFRSQTVVYRVLPMEIPGVPNSMRSSNFESTRVREVVKEHLADSFACEPGQIDIARRQGRRGLGPPVVLVKGVESRIDLSMSHDGRFLAFAYCSL